VTGPELRHVPWSQTHWDREADVVVVGSGAAGMTAALTAARHGRNVLLVSKEDIGGGATPLAQGGLAAAIGPGDDPGLHERDTLNAGAGLCDPAAVVTLTCEAPGEIARLAGRGARLERTALHLEAGHSRKRIVNAGGDAIGAEVMAFVHYWWEVSVLTGDEPAIPEPCRDVWEDFKRFTRGLNLPIDELHRRIHGGHCTWLREEERRFVTPELIKASSPLVGTPDEIIDHLRSYEAAGVGEVVILCPTAPSREVYTDIRDHVMDRY